MGADKSPNRGMAAWERRRILQWRLYRARKKATWRFLRPFFRDTNHEIDHTVFLAGSARSGTTWLANLLASQLQGRVLFEPFNPELVRAYRNFDYFHFAQPGEQAEELRQYCTLLFRGKIRDAWIDRQIERLHPHFRVVKSVRASLMLAWLHKSFPELPLLFLVRHPCAVVLSRMRLGWDPEVDLKHLLALEPLRTHYLADRLDVINAARTVEEQNAVIWCILNLVPLRQFGLHSVPVIFYEDICTQPEATMAAVFEHLAQPYNVLASGELRRPSTTSHNASAVVRGEDPVRAWQNQLSTSQVTSILTIVEAFELGFLYEDSPTPQVRNIGILRADREVQYE